MSRSFARSTSGIMASTIMGALLAVMPAAAAEHGEVLWFDLVTEDVAAAADFYEGLLGWDIAADRNGLLVVRHQGRDIAGLVQINDQEPGTSESQWLVGIVTDDLDRTVVSARAAGGAILRKITEVEGSGRYAVLRDPQGAPFIVGVPARDIGGRREPGFFVWTELWTDDVDAAAEFYGEVLGYERRAVERPGGAYTVLQTGGTPRAGLVPTPDDEVQPAWAPYIGVADLQTTLRRTVELGGRVVLEPRDDFGGGRVALIEDPTHALVFVAQLSPGKGDS